MDGTPQPRFAAAKMLVARALCHPWLGAAIGRWYRDEIPDRRGCVIRTPAPVAASVKALLFWGLYESAEVRFVRQYLRGDLDVVELGSSIGVVGSHAARELRSDHRLVCVEANPRLVPILEENVRRNGRSAAITVVNAAISYSGESQIDLSIGETNLDGAVGGRGHSVRVPAVTLSQVVRENGVRRYCLICDIEGSEVELILHDGAALEGCEQIIIELHDVKSGGRSWSPPQIAQAFMNAGYQARAQYGPVYVFERG